MKPYDPTAPVIFAHVPKCAGTSLIRVLRRWFVGEFYHPHVNESEPGTSLPQVQLKNSKGHWATKIKCIHAHFDHGRGYGLPYHFPDVKQYISFVRDPFDIVVSMYFFAKGRGLRGEFLYDGKQVDIREQYPSVEHYVKQHPVWLYNHFPQDITLENYQTAIHERYVYLGLFEDMQASVHKLARILNKAYVELPKRNQSIYDEPVPEQLREWFYDEHPLLVGIYEIAKENHLVTEPEIESDSNNGESRHRVGRLFNSLFGK